MSGGLRGIIPAIVAVGVGVFTGYYTFQPALRDLDYERRTKEKQESHTTLAGKRDLPDTNETESKNASISSVPPALLAETREKVSSTTGNEK